MLIVQLYLIFQHCFLHYNADLFVGGQSKTRLLISYFLPWRNWTHWDGRRNGKPTRKFNRCDQPRGILFTLFLCIAAILPPSFTSSDILLLSFDCQSSFDERMASSLFCRLIITLGLILPAGIYHYFFHWQLMDESPGSFLPDLFSTHDPFREVKAWLKLLRPRSQSRTLGWSIWAE